MGVLIDVTTSSSYFMVTVDVTDFVTSARYSYDIHGCSTAIVTLRAMPRTQGNVAMDGGRLTITDGSGGVAWGGRIESVETTSDGITLVAYGGWRVLGDVRYTALWSATSTADWTLYAETEHAPGHSAPQRYEIDNNNRLYIAPRKNEVFGGTGGFKVGGLAFRAPSNGLRPLTHISFDWTTTFPSVLWRLVVNDATNAPYGAPWTFNTFYLIATGSGSGSFATVLGSGIVGIIVYVHFTSPDAVYAGETGAAFARVTNVRVTSAPPPITAHTIIDHVFAHAQASNVMWLRGAVFHGTPTIDHFDAIYEDADPREIIDALCRAENMIATIDAFGGLYVRPLPNAIDSQRWRIAPSAVQVTQSFESVVTDAYAVYRSPSGQALRTATATSHFAETIPFRRVRNVATRTTSITTANAVRDAFLSASEYPSTTLRIRAKPGDITGAYGGRATGSMIRAYDVIEISGVQTAPLLRVGRVTVDALTGETEIETLTPSDTLENAIAQR